MATVPRVAHASRSIVYLVAVILMIDGCEQMLRDQKRRAIALFKTKKKQIVTSVAHTCLQDRSRASEIELVEEVNAGGQIEIA